MRVLIAGGGTGGHLMPALAIAEALRDLRPELEPVLVGARRGVEARLLPERGTFRYHLLPAEPLYRRAWWRNARWVGLLPGLVRRCRQILDEERPVFAVGTGGYAAGPILFGCVRRGIPIALQDQNARPGVTTRWLARCARQVHLGFPEAQRFLRTGRHTEVFTLGNPIVPPATPRPSQAEAKRALGLDPSEPTCFVMGGSQGALSINRALASALDAGLLPDIALLWSTGSSTWERFQRYHDPPRRQVRPFWDPVAEAYAAADVVASRAGAMTLAELAAWGVPAVLIPLPTAAAGHQAVNAEALEQAGCAVHLPEAELSPSVIAGRVRTLLGDEDRLAEMARLATERSQPYAAQAIAERLLDLAE